MVMLRAVGYVRQSRESQAAASPEAQRQAIAQYAESQGWRLVETFSDIGRSGFDPKVQRPGLEALLGLVGQGGVDRVIVWKLDRLTRRGISEALSIVERVERAQAALVSVTEPFDTSSALGQGIFALLLSLARAESEKLAERVRSGKKVVRERGGWLGGPIPYGFAVERVANGGYMSSRLVLDSERAPVVRQMVADVLDGKSVREIVRGLNAGGVAPPRGREWSHASVSGLLRNPVLAGQLPDGHGGVTSDPDGVALICGEPLLTPDEWRELQRRVAPRKGRKPQVPSLLGGIIICAGCGTTMGADRSRNQYRCNRYASGKSCPEPAAVPMRATDRYVLNVLGANLLNAIEIREALGAFDDDDVYERTLQRFARWWALRGSPTDLETLAHERENIEAARARLREMYAAGDFADDPTQYRTLFDRYEHRYQQLTDQLAAFEELPAPTIVSQPGFIHTLDFDTQRDLINELAHGDIRCHKANRPGIKFNPYTRIQWEG